MTINDATTYLKYANLQLAAEAFLKLNLAGKDLSDALKEGNNRTSKFTNTSADDFASKWQVVATQGNTNTGFSGTLFVCIADDPALGYKAGEQVISFRSTEFADDAVRDNKATNMLEIQATGWAFGQIDDMKKWVDSLYASGKISPANSLDVTGYSLGGHLATAFNLLYPGAVRNTYTFNGAGVGVVKPGASLTQVIAQFDRQRVNADGKQIVFSDADANLILQQLRVKLTSGVNDDAWRMAA
jgi:pimeloyl-ACP methyl ester carboxylesterase